jgi:hypothetical protein
VKVIYKPSKLFSKLCLITSKCYQNKFAVEKNKNKTLVMLELTKKLNMCGMGCNHAAIRDLSDDGVLCTTYQQLKLPKPRS